MNKETTLKKTILFVDDDEDDLFYVQQGLASRSDKWHMFFVQSGQAALKVLEEQHVDVIVSDLRMPHMGGIELLALVQDQYPDIICFVVSAYWDKEMILSLLGLSSHFIPKPCNIDELGKEIENAIAGHPRSNDMTQDIVAKKLNFLPTLSGLFQKFRFNTDQQGSFYDIAEIVSRDIIISSKIIFSIHAAQFGLRQDDEDFQYSLSYLAMETLKTLILQSDFLSGLSKQQIDIFHIREFYNNSIFVGFLARSIAQSVSKDPALVDDAGAAGVLHDCGKIVLIRNFTSDYEKIFSEFKDFDKSFSSIERKYHGLSHSDVGAYLMSLWGISDATANVVKQQHTPCIKEVDRFDCSTAVYIASRLADEVFEEQKDGKMLSENETLDEAFLSRLGLSKYLPSWRKTCRSMARYNKPAVIL